MIGRAIVYIAIFSSIFSAAPVVLAQYEDQELLSLDLKGMEIRDVLKILSQKSGLNIVADSDVKGTVSLYVKDVDVMDALDIIITANDLAYEEKGSLIRVMTAGKYEELHGSKFRDTMETETIKLNHAKAFNVVTVLTKMKTKMGKLIADDASNTIILIDNAENLKRMKSVILEIDVPVAAGEISSGYAWSDSIDARSKKTFSKDKEGSKDIDPRSLAADTSFRPPEKEKPSDLKTGAASSKIGKKTEEGLGSEGPDKKVVQKTAYEAYYLMIRDEMNRLAERQDVLGLSGEVELQFTLDKDGFLTRGPIVLNKPDLTLVRAAVDCVRLTSPFPPFPKGLTEEETEVYVVLRYE